jgi:hypothetical protein
MLLSTSTADQAADADVYPHARTLAWLASLSVAGGNLRAAEGYLLELLALCVFAERVVDDHSD